MMATLELWRDRIKIATMNNLYSGERGAFPSRIFLWHGKGCPAARFSHEYFGTEKVLSKKWTNGQDYRPSFSIYTLENQRYSSDIKAQQSYVSNITKISLHNLVTNVFDNATAIT